MVTQCFTRARKERPNDKYNLKKNTIQSPIHPQNQSIKNNIDHERNDKKKKKENTKKGMNNIYPLSNP